MAAGPASAKTNPPPSVHLQCTAAPINGMLHGSICVQFPPGLSLQTFSDPRDANDELAGTPATAGAYTFTMRLSDYDGQQATQKFTFTIDR
jgi:hypothetical protein